MAALYCWLGFTANCWCDPYRLKPWLLMLCAAAALAFCAMFWPEKADTILPLPCFNPGAPAEPFMNAGSLFCLSGLKLFGSP